jgi:5-methylcytosine-specific restriction endonuclease McrA
MSWLWPEPRKKRVPVKVLKQMVWEHDKGICQICKKPASHSKFDLAHKRAKHYGGQLTSRNTCVAHPTCNRSQGTLSLRQTQRIVGTAPRTPRSGHKPRRGKRSRDRYWDLKL